MTDDQSAAYAVIGLAIIFLPLALHWAASLITAIRKD